MYFSPVSFSPPLQNVIIQFKINYSFATPLKNQKKKISFYYTSNTLAITKQYFLTKQP